MKDTRKFLRGGISPALIVAVVAMGFVLFAFTRNANPYGTFADAKMSKEDRMHIAGDVVGDIKRDVVSHTLTFDLQDAKGQKCAVVHQGEWPSNLAETKKVVVIGRMQGDHFQSQQMLVKCPSKYDQQNGAARS